METADILFSTQEENDGANQKDDQQNEPEFLRVERHL